MIYVYWTFVIAIYAVLLAGVWQLAALWLEE